jgi:hypothetical protein
MFGKRYDFHLSASNTALDPRQYRHANGVPVTKQKNQIVLHYTAGNGSATGTIGAWNGNAAMHPPRFSSANFIVEVAEDRRDTSQPYADVVEVVPSDNVPFHAQEMNDNAIGIENANVGWDFVSGAHDAYTGQGLQRRPTDLNRWLHLPLSALRATQSNLVSQDFQAYQEEQYLTLLLLLRYLCIKHRIPRRFLGDTTREKMRRWLYNIVGTDVALRRSQLARFRGILSHMNCHKNKECGGPAMHRNRLFRGIIDEWWMPIESGGSERPYYTGPLRPRPNTASLVRFENDSPLRELFHDADLDALQETKSYFTLDDVDFYTALGETMGLGGSFPIGGNRIWHGGVHLKPERLNPKVYAAASGTIVAARLGSDAGAERVGSQRFVLVRHAVHLAREADPGGGQRTNYTADPTYVFSLYMHLAPFVDLRNDHVNNPPWYNVWLGRHPSDDPTRVFSPDVEVSVGDMLGRCGKFAGQTMLHFEVMSHEELREAPWNDPRMRGYDPSANAIADPHVIEQFLGAVFPRGGKGVDPLVIAERFRNAKIFHKSEWALSGPDDLKPVLSDTESRRREWETARHFVWIADAIARRPELRSQLCDEHGLMWSYHPITFMTHVNRLVHEENAEVAEPDMRQTNVVMEDELLTEFVTFQGGQAQPQAADGARLVPFDIPPLQGGPFDYTFTRREVACLIPGAHGANGNPPVRTRFHVTLLDFIESLRRQSGHPLTVRLSHVCETHHTPAHAQSCVLGVADALSDHANGLAADLQLTAPITAPTPASCADLWRAARLLQDQFRISCEGHSGEPSRTDLPEDAHHVNLLTTPAVQTKLAAGTLLTAQEAAHFVLHVDLVIITSRVTWECWLRRSSRATAARVHEGGVLAVYDSELDAQHEGEQRNTWRQPWGWETWIRRHSNAISVKVYDGGIIGVYRSRDFAEAEKGGDVAWAKP